MRFQHVTLTWPSPAWMMGAGTVFQVSSVEQAYAVAAGALVTLASQSFQVRVLEATFTEDRLCLVWPEGNLDVPLRSLGSLTLNRGSLVLQVPGIHLCPVQHHIHWPVERELQELATEIGRRFRAARLIRRSQPAPRPAPVRWEQPKPPVRATESSARHHVEDWFW